MTGSDDGRAASVELGPDDRDQPAGRILALLLDAFLEDFKHLEPAVIGGRDPDALHDYRVVLRRTRSLLRAGRDVYPPEELELLQALASQLASATSPVRDLDVLLEAFGEYAEPLAPELADGAELLRTELERQRAQAQRELVGLIRGDSHPALVRRWQIMGSVHRIGGSEPGPDALRPMGEVADELIERAHDRVLRHGRTLLESSDRSDWHTLRKRLKRLRYVLASFSPLYPDGAFDPLVKELVKLQDRFGALQDDLTHCDLIVEAGTRLGGSAALSAGAIADGLHHRAAQDLRRCRKRWGRMESKDMRRLVRSAVRRS